MIPCFGKPTIFLTLTASAHKWGAISCIGCETIDVELHLYILIDNSIIHAMKLCNSLLSYVEFLFNSLFLTLENLCSMLKIIMFVLIVATATMRGSVSTVNI